MVDAFLEVAMPEQIAKAQTFRQRGANVPLCLAFAYRLYSGFY